MPQAPPRQRQRMIGRTLTASGRNRAAAKLMAGPDAGLVPGHRKVALATIFCEARAAKTPRIRGHSSAGVRTRTDFVYARNRRAHSAALGSGNGPSFTKRSGRVSPRTAGGRASEG